MKRLYYVLGFSLVALPGIAYADDTPPADSNYFSGSIAGVTDYRFRGLSQTQEDPAVQAGIEWNHPSGFKLGVWASNVDFNTTGGGSLETDIYGSYTWKFDPAWSLETGLYYYAYPGSSSHLDYNYGEAYAIANYTYDILTLSGSFNYTPDNFGGSGNAYYPQLTASVVLPHDFTLDGAIGRQWIEKNTVAGVPDYNTWNLGLAYTYQGFTGKLQYVDTDISKARCAVGCDAAGVLSVTKKF